MRVGCVQLTETLMEFKEAIKLALQSLWQNKMRTVLTLLGVTIGVASVIAVVTLVNGANTYVTDKFTRYGADVFTISRFPALITNATDYERFQRRKNILYDDYAYVRDNCTHCIGIGAQQATVAKVTRGTNSVTDPTIRGYTWQMPSLENLDIAEGRDFTQVDDDHASSVAIIGTDIRDNLFPGIDPLGQELRVDGQPYTVIGVAEKQGSTFGQSQDNWVGVPLTAYQKTYGTMKSLTIYVKAGSAGAVPDPSQDRRQGVTEISQQAAFDQRRQILKRGSPRGQGPSPLPGGGRDRAAPHTRLDQGQVKLGTPGQLPGLPERPDVPGPPPLRPPPVHAEQGQPVQQVAPGQVVGLAQVQVIVAGRGLGPQPEAALLVVQVLLQRHHGGRGRHGAEPLTDDQPPLDQVGAQGAALAQHCARRLRSEE